MGYARIKNNVVVLLFLSTALCCNKKEFLDASPGTQLAVPGTPADLQAVLDNVWTMNHSLPLTEISGDDYYTDYANWTTLPITAKNAYKWAADIYEGRIDTGDWYLGYKQVYSCNVVLEELARMPVATGRQNEWNAIKGSALFMRAWAFYNLAQLFAPAYDSTMAAHELGIVVRLKSDIREPSVRATLKETYDQVLNDLMSAIPLLPPLNTMNRARPSVPAAQAMLARVYLSMGRYSLASQYAEECLQAHGMLMDYNQVDANKYFMFARNNPEVLYQSGLYSGSFTSYAWGFYVDSLLYQSYANEDIRKNVFFMLLPDGKPAFRGSYSGDAFLFTGLATDELYLVKAECAARQGKTNEAIYWLNWLLVKRFTTGSFVPVTAATPAEALQKILTERRKELVMRSMRWPDVKRLNKANAAITLTRILDNQTYQLPANNNRFTLPIPPDVIARTGMPQNPR